MSLRLKEGIKMKDCSHDDAMAEVFQDNTRMAAATMVSF